MLNNGIRLFFVLSILSGIALFSVPYSVIAVDGKQQSGDKDGEIKQHDSQKRMITLNFDDVDIKIMIKFISELTGKNFIIDDKVKGKVTIVSPTRITIDEAFRVFESVLEVQGFTTVQAGKIIKIIPAREARHRDVVTRYGRDTDIAAREDRMITQLIPLKYADADEIKKLFAPLISKDSSIVAYSATNTLILTDISSNIHRLISIIDEIDVEGSQERVLVIPLEYASAETLSKELLSLFETKGKRQVSARRGAAVSTETAIKIIPDQRTNSVILQASLQDTVRIRSLIEKMDKPTPRGKDTIHVYYLEHASAEDLAGVLTKIPSKGQDKGAPNVGAQNAPVLGKDVSITADKSTNSLIIVASPQDYTVLQEIVRQLDVMRAQVLVEALIAEVSMDKTKQLGIEWRSLEQPEAGTTTVFGGTSLPIGTEGASAIDQLAAAPFGGSPSGLFLGAVKGTISFGNAEFLNMGSLVRAFQTDTDVNILSTPHLLTMDNEEAEIIVGEERPFLKTSQVTDVGTTTRTFEYKDLGLTLRITPQISKGKVVKLKIFQEIKSFVEQVEVGAINTTKRQAKTTVIVEDGETVVIGGLIRDDTRQSKTQVPCLGQIPLMGWLFKSYSENSVKTNLLVFVTPHIINSPEDLRRVTEEKMKESEKVKKGYEKKRGEEIKNDIELLIHE